MASIPASLKLLPHCLKHSEGCPADYDEFGLDCKTCGACSIADFRSRAEDLGYKVLVAEGTPIVLKIILSGYVDAIVGVACLNVLEKAGLIISEKRGRTRELYFNATPIQTIHERWTTDYSAHWAGRLTEFKRNVESSTK